MQMTGSPGSVSAFMTVFVLIISHIEIDMKFFIYTSTLVTRGAGDIQCIIKDTEFHMYGLFTACLLIHN
jgi:hypothetical protein